MFLKKQILGRNQNPHAAPAGAAVMFSLQFFGRCLFLDLLFVFLTEVPKLTGFENKNSEINYFFYDRSLLQM